MAGPTGVFSLNPNFYLEVVHRVESQSITTNHSIIYYQIRVVKTAYAEYSGIQGQGSWGWADSNTGKNPDLWENDDLPFDFRNGVANGVWIFKEGTFRIDHRTDGTAEYAVTSQVKLHLLGEALATSGVRALPRLASPTPAPRPIGIDQVTMTSMRYRFSSQGAGAGNLPVIEWQIGWGTDPNSPQNYLKSTGTSTVKVSPGTMYYFWSRGRNAMGWGPWSRKNSQQSIAGARILVGGVRKEAVPYVKSNGVWVPAQPYVKLSGVWKPTG